MGKLLWKPSDERIGSANMTKFIDFVNKRYGLEINSYFPLYEWSTGNIRDFWAAMWEFGEIKASRRWDVVLDDFDRFPGAKWFVS